MSNEKVAEAQRLLDATFEVVQGRTVFPHGAHVQTNMGSGYVVQTPQFDHNQQGWYHVIRDDHQQGGGIQALHPDGWVGQAWVLSDDEMIEVIA